MVDAEAPTDPIPCDPWLADYRAAVERFRQETVAELGRQPNAPESAAMVAVLVAALPLVALFHPSVPFHLQVWQVGLVQAAVWSGVFWYQRRRYDRFHERLRRKIAAYQAAEGAAMAPRLLKRRFSPAHPGRRPATALRRSVG
jgi:hypothetical protein